jgi:hypothetical protein
MNIVSKKAISVTLTSENLTWLRARVGARGARSVSDLLDGLVTQARATGGAGPARSVVGTVDLDPMDPLLLDADVRVRRAFEESLGKPLTAREARSRYRPKRRSRG